MLKNESVWFSKIIKNFSIEELSPLINIGSNTEHFRRNIHPWINSELFLPLKHRGIETYHTDILGGVGVDLVGDLQDEIFLKKLKGMTFKSALCTHLFEHVNNKENIASAIESIIVKGGYLFISCPFKFPYHPGPIDTMYRPNINELKLLFPRCDLINSSYVRESVVYYLFNRFSTNPLNVINKFFKKSLDYKNKDVPTTSISEFTRWIHKYFISSCIVLRKF